MFSFKDSTTSVDLVELRAVDAPADMPSFDTIVQCCFSGHKNGICFPVEGPRFWIKYGSNISLGEALTQDWVARKVNDDPAFLVGIPKVYLVFSRGLRRFIVMQYIEGGTVASRQPSKRKYAAGDLDAVAAAFNQLVSIRVPKDTQPGYVGGGPIGNTFFDERLSAYEYPTVAHLHTQINNVCGLLYENRPRHRVDFSDEIEDGLVLCLSDIDSANFMIDSNGKVFAIDFGCTGFMPPSYVSYALQDSKVFTQRVASRVQYPRSPHFNAMQSVARMMAQSSGGNKLGYCANLPSGR